MDEQKREFLEQHYAAAEWMGRQITPGIARNLSLAGSELPGWTMVRIQRQQSATLTFIQSVWQRGESTNEVITVRITECATAAAAQNQLLEELGNFESMMIRRRGGVGDVAFGLDESVILFARSNLVVVILNGGAQLVSVVSVAQNLDAVIRQRLA
jgi:hypothetical protein